MWNNKKECTNETGIRILKLLKQRGMSQRQLADAIDISEVSMSRYIHGERNPRAKIAQKMAYALHTTPDYILGMEELEPIEIAYARLLRNVEKYRSKLDMNQKLEIINTLLLENEEDQKNKIKAELAGIEKKMAELQKQKENLNDLLE